MPVLMKARVPHLSIGWIIVIGVALVMFGTAGSRFSFGVFLTPLTDDFGWSRGGLSGALAIAGLATALMRPLAGAAADRFDPVRLALFGVLLGGLALLGLSRINELWQLYVLFLVMGIGFTLASPATLTKLVSARFTRRRGLALSLAGSGSAVGETALVPLAAVVLTLSGWRPAYVALAIILLLVIIPASYALLRLASRPISRDESDEMATAPAVDSKQKNSRTACAWMPDDGMSLRQAIRTPMFWALTVGFFT